MSGKTNDSSVREQRVNEAIAAYLEAVDAGGAPDPEEFIAAHSEIAPELESFFTNRDEFERMAEPLQTAGDAAPSPQADDPTLPPTDQPTEAPTLAPTETAGVAIGTMLRYFGDYELLEEIARGGMGVVYKARQVTLNRIVALKMILAGQLASEEDVQRFHAEAEAAANLDHPGIVPIFEVGEHEGQHYFSMGFVEGSSLSAKVADGPLPPKEAAELVRAVAEAVQYAHDNGVIHRDLKPANVLLAGSDQQSAISREKEISDPKLRADSLRLTACVPKVTDFGLAKKVEGDSGLTATGQILGTPGYMPPEQASGKIDEVTETADVYSLGAILYCLLTARPPFQADNSLDTLMQVLEQEPVSPRTLNPKVPLDLETICLKCLEKDRRRRYDSARALTEELERFLDGRAILARPISRPARLWRWCKRKPALATASGLAALATAAALVTLSIAVVLVTRSRNKAIGLAEANARLADEKGHLADEKGHLADENAAMAKTERSLRKTAERQTATLFFEQSYSKCGQGDTARGMLWLARSMQEARRADVPELEQSARLQLAGWQGALHPLRCVLRHAPPSHHSLAASSVVFGPNGKTVLVAQGTTAQQWDVATGKPVGPSLDHQAQVTTVAFSPDGKTVLTGGGNTARLWDVATGKANGPALERKQPINAAAFSPDGAMVLIGCGVVGQVVGPEKPIGAQLWDVATGKPTGPTLEHRASINAVAFSPDGKVLLTGGWDNTARLWDPKTGNAIGPPLIHDSVLRAVAFSPDGKVVVTHVNDGSAQLWDAETGKPTALSIKRQGYIRAVAFSPDGKTMITGLADNTARLWEVGTWKALGAPLLHQGMTMVTAVAFNPDGKFVLTGGGNTARLWDLATGKPIGPALEHLGTVVDVRFSPDGKTMLTDTYDHTARLWQVGPGTAKNRTLDCEGPLTAVVFSPDAKTLLTGSLQGPARLWDAQTEKPIGPPLQHRGLVAAAVFSADERIVVTSTLPFVGLEKGARVAQLWNGRTGEAVGPPLEHRGVVTAVEFSPDGKTVLTAATILAQAGSSIGGTIHRARLWDVATGQPASPPLEHQGLVGAVAFSTDGKTVLTVSSGQRRAGDWNSPPVLAPELRRWDAATGKPIGVAWQYHHPDLASGTLAFSADRRKVLARTKFDARLLDVATGEPLGPAIQHPVGHSVIALSPDAKTVLTGGRDQTARLWVAATGKALIPPLKHPGPVTAVAFSPDGKTVLTANEGYDRSGEIGEVRLWESETGKPLHPPLKQEGRIWRTAFSPDGKTVLTGGQGGFPPGAVGIPRKGLARLWNVETGQALHPPFEHKRAVVAVAFSPDGKTVITASADKTAQLWVVATGKPLGDPLEHQGKLKVVAFSPDAGTVITGAECPMKRLAEARAWEVATGKPIGLTFEHEEDAIRALAVSPDGRIVLTGTERNKAHLWQVATGKPLTPPLEHKSEVTVVAFSPNGKTVLTATERTGAHLWDVATGKPIGAALKHQSAVTAVAFSPDGKAVLTGSNDKTARLWDAATGEPLTAPFQHQGPVAGIAFSPDGKTVLTGSSDKTARLWDVATVSPIGPPLQHQSPVGQVAFGPGGQTALTATAEATVQLWDLRTSKAVGPPLEGRAFTPDGRVALTGAMEGTLRLTRIPAPMDGEPDRLVLWTQVLTGMELDQAGGGHVLDAQTWQQRRQRLEQLGGPPNEAAQAEPAVEQVGPADTTNSTSEMAAAPAHGQPQQPAPLRQWTDRTGKFSIEARFLRLQDGKAVLEKKDGTTIQVAPEQLSAKDQEDIRARASKASNQKEGDSIK
ncbi:MAG: protein kinase [Planctomycetes bacterium]|nr:protein kinase [Planctomycetota bacterium]MBL7041978.1 protein kinase [Pirellulaceae bacterium]